MVVVDLSVSAVINAVSRRYFLQANDATDMKDWISALNRASKITVRAAPLPRVHAGITERPRRALARQRQFVSEHASVNGEIVNVQEIER